MDMEVHGKHGKEDLLANCPQRQCIDIVSALPPHPPLHYNGF